MKGRKPKPTALKELAGNPGKRPLNEREPRFRRRLPRCPGHLSAEAKREWRRVARELYDAGLLTAVDRAALAAYCQAWGRWVRAEEELEETGWTCVTSKGNVIQHPMVGIANQAHAQMVKYAAEFGMTPSSRSRVKAGEPLKQEKTLAELLFEGVEEGRGG